MPRLSLAAAVRFSTRVLRRLGVTLLLLGAARAGVENLTRSLAVEWAEAGVRVAAVAPGVVASTSARANYDFDVFGQSIPGVPAQRLGSVQEVCLRVLLTQFFHKSWRLPLGTGLDNILRRTLVRGGEFDCQPRLGRCP